ncbi:MAG TPA: hypothetical protein VHP81_05375 [Lachnospiraceae bacterium]|nr:hypothetical protein [Lachnospiraceae bacterium]
MKSIRAVLSVAMKISDEKRKLLKVFGILFLAELISYKLPHDSYSISQYIFPPIKLGNTTAYLSGILFFILVIYCISNIVSLDRYKYRSRLGLFLLILIIVMPIMRWTIDVVRTNIYWLTGDGLHAVDIEESNIFYSSNSYSESDRGDLFITIDLKVKDYGRERKDFRVRVYLPETLRELVGIEYLDLEQQYQTQGKRVTINVNEQMKVVVDDKVLERISYGKIVAEDVKYKLYNEKESITIIDHGY